MKVDHLGADIHGHCICILTHLKAETAIKREHRISVLHWQRNMIEPAHPAGLLRPKAGTTACRTRGHDRLHESAT
jgi:hypothetical protein